MAPVTQIEVNGRTFDVTLSGETFFVELDGDNVYGESIKLLKARVKERMGALKLVAIPATLIDDDSWRRSDKGLSIRHVTVTGIHSRTHAITFRDGTGKAGTANRNGEVYQRLTKEQEQEVKALYAAKKKAERAWETALNKLSMQVEAEIEKAAYLGSDNP